MKRLALLLIGLLLVIPMIVSADYVVQPGDVVFMGEYVDITHVVGWGGEFAWFENGYDSKFMPRETPALIVDASAFQRHYYINPNKFRYGHWYKWDGKYEDGNMEAFTVQPGARPTSKPTLSPESNLPIVPEPTVTVSVDIQGVQMEVPVPVWTFPILENGTTRLSTVVGTTIPMQNNTLEMIPYNYQQTIDNETDVLLIARGDTIEYRGGEIAGAGTKTLNLNGSLWIFNDNGVIADYPLHFVRDSYWFRLPSTITQDFPEGTTTIVLQTNGLNGIKEVGWDAGSKTLTSPWKQVPDRSVAGLPASFALDDFLEFVNTKPDGDPAKYDDQILIKKLKVEPFWVNIEEMYSDNYYMRGKDKTLSYVMMSGKTNAAPHTPIIFCIDRDKYGTEEEASKHYLQTNVNEGNFTEPRSWRISFSPDLDNLAPGFHEVSFWIPIGDINEKSPITTVQFEVREHIVNPEPGPEWHKYVLTNSSLEPAPTPIPPPTPEIHYVFVNDTSKATVVDGKPLMLLDESIPTPTPITIIETVTVIVYRTPEGVHALPATEYIPVIAFIVCAAFVLIRRRE